MVNRQSVIDHAEREGREDYEGRAADVAGGQQESAWAWPFVAADEAYINAVTIKAICAEIGVSVDVWDEICTTWCAAFRRGYVDAHVDAYKERTEVGDRVRAGYGADRDSGRIISVDGDYVTVAWDGGIRTTQRWDALLDLEVIS